MVEKQIRERVIETSLKLFASFGYHGVSVNQIVKESGTSKGGFYHNFKSKDELLYVIHDYFISYVLNKAKEAEQNYRTSTDQLCAIIRSFVKVFDIYKPHLSVFYQESHYLKQEYDEQIKIKRDQYKDVIFRVLREGIENGEFREELPVEITGMSILGMVNWTYKWYRKEGEKTIEEIADIFIDLLLHSILTEETKCKDANQRYFIKSQQLRT
jgi:AcrR family transcriptional regulator